MLETLGARRRGRLSNIRSAPYEASTNRQSAFASLQVLDRAAVDVEQPRRARDVREALRARDRDVESVARQQEVESARHVLAARRRHRVEDDRGLAALELVDRADLDAGAGSRSRSSRTWAL